MGWVKDKGSRPQFKEGGKVKTKMLTDTPIESEEVRKIGRDKGVRVVLSIPTEQVGGKGGGKRRKYEGIASEGLPHLSRAKAAAIARNKMAFSPGDSLRTTKGEHEKLTRKEFKKKLKKQKQKYLK